MDHIDCACLLHGDYYDWIYVEKLYNGLCRNLSVNIRFHVYTEKNRPVPAHMIHHPLVEWDGIHGPKKAWWYKLQLFNTNFHRGPLFYLDLDTVICGNLDWVYHLPLDKFWAARDFKYLMRPNKVQINSSVMWFDTEKFNYIYREFDPGLISKESNRHYYGDQDYIQEKLARQKWCCFDTNRIKSWRWELFDGGFDFKDRIYRTPNTKISIPKSTSIVVFHGDPKPHTCGDLDILRHWI